MADDVPFAAESRYRVDEWFIAFKRSSAIPLARWLTVGQRFQHVSCFGFVHVAGCWVFHDWHAGGVALHIVPDEDADPFIGAVTDDAVVVRFVPPIYPAGYRLKAGFWCVTSVAHLTAVRSCALRPDALFRDCLAQGGTIVAGHEHESEAAQGGGAGPRAAAPAGSGAH